MKKVSLFLFVVFSSAVSIFAAGSKNNTALTFSVTPIDKDETDDVQFGGAYFLTESTMSDDYVTLGGKLYYRLNKTDSKEAESQKVEIKRAYAKIRPFGEDFFEFALGKLYSYYLPGGYFSLTETYTGASRWGETGIAAKIEKNGFTFGLALPLTESYVEFRKNWGLNFAAVYDFSTVSKELPLTLGADILYSATGDDDSDVNSISEKDFSECVSVNYSKRNVSFFKNLAVFAAFSHNVRPYVAHTILSPVAVVSNSKSAMYADVKKSNLFSLAVRPTIGSVKITSESEIGHSVEGTVVPFYSALQIYFPVTEILSIKPLAGYYAAFDTSDSSNSFDTWEFYPRILLEFEKWTFTAGWDTFYKEISDSEYRWLWTVPLTAKVKIGE